MIVFRQVDDRYPFLWEDASQPAARWHAEGDGPVHYYSDTPEGAWAEFLRHEEITDLQELRTIRRQMWAVDVGDVVGASVDLPLSGQSTRHVGWIAAEDARPPSDILERVHHYADRPVEDTNGPTNRRPKRRWTVLPGYRDIY